jgi:homoserine dehydrogenase
VIESGCKGWLGGEQVCGVARTAKGEKMNMRLAILGFGNVGRAFARLLLRKAPTLEADYDLTCSVVGLMTARHGGAVDPQGIDLQRALNLAESGASLDVISAAPPPEDGVLFVHTCTADVLIELTPLNLDNGEPAITHVRTALEKGMHVVSANKGPLAFGYRELCRLAASQERGFLFESTVMDGAPVFGLARAGLPAARVLGFRGVLNSTTNYILTRMETGDSYEEAVAGAQAMGIAETDPSADVDGWDATVKTVVLANVLLGADLRPDEVSRSGIRDVTPLEIEAARARGRRIKLVCQAERQGNGFGARVAPEEVPLDDPLASLDGTTSMVTLRTDTLKGLSLIEFEPEPAQTAYGLLADLINLARGWY